MFLPAPDESIWVGVLRLQLEVPASRSLKDKRRVVASVRDRLRARHHLTVAEVGHLNDRSRVVLAVATVSNDARVVRSALDKVAAEIGGGGEAFVVAADVDIWRPHGEWEG